MGDRWLIKSALAVQGACTVFFVADILSSYIGFSSKPIAWKLREMIEVGAAIGLLLGFLLGMVALTRTQKRRRDAEARLKRAASAFMDVVETDFNEWGLTPAERDVALFLIKGLTVPEIAAMRSTSEGTVKAQTNAIYRKAGVGGRSQLLSLFIDELMDEGLMAEARDRAGPQAAQMGRPVRQPVS